MNDTKGPLDVLLAAEPKVVRGVLVGKPPFKAESLADWLRQCVAQVERDRAWWRFEGTFTPAYLPSQAARYAECSRSFPWRWMDRRPLRMSFAEAVEMAVASRMVRAGFTVKEAKETRAAYAEYLRCPHPFASEAMKATPVGGIEPVTDLFSRFDCADGVVSRWWLRGREGHVYADPMVGFGLATVNSIATLILVDNYRAGATVDDLMDDYGLTREEVKAGLRFEGVEVDG